MLQINTLQEYSSVELQRYLAGKSFTDKCNVINSCITCDDLRLIRTSVLVLDVVM